MLNIFAVDIDVTKGTKRFIAAYGSTFCHASRF
jgi:hypothetical protein